MVPILKPLTTNEFTVKDSFHFAEEIVDQQHDLFMGSLDVDSLFTNIPLDETLYKQIDGVAMGSPLGPTLANASLVYHEKNWLEHCPVEYRPLYYRRYVDDIFVLFNSAEHLKRFYSYLNSRYLNISLTIENEKDNRMSFLDVNIIRGKDKFTTSVYRKPTFSGVYTHFDSFLPSCNKIGLLHTSLYRCFRICSDWTKFHLELVKLTDVFKNNGYSENFIDNFLKCFCIANIEYKKK